ncbi:MAG: hypothetical protein IJJ88_06355, partial [Oscillospiraceae bacterium]|nr:hypothetical protein [Oscillospiraceae bacterium]
PINMTSYSRVQNTSCLEVVTGGLFYDKEKYNQISFSIGTIEWDETLSQYSATIDYYVCLYAIGDRTGKIGNWLHGQSKWPPKDSFPLSFPQPASSQDRESAERPKNKKNQEANTNYEERSGQPSPPLKNLPLPDDPLRIKNLLIDRKSGRDSQQRKGEKNEC